MSKWKNFRVPGKYGKKNTTSHVTTPTPERAEKYAQRLIQQRGGLPANIGKAEEVDDDPPPLKKKKP